MILVRVRQYPSLNIGVNVESKAGLGDLAMSSSFRFAIARGIAYCDNHKPLRIFTLPYIHNLALPWLV